MMVVVGAVSLPARYFIREAIVFGAAVASYFLPPRRIHDLNSFGFAPIKEVAFLFAGIFLTMMPALGYLERHGAELGIARPLQYYFATGGLSADLDNAPTYVNFLQLALTTTAAQDPTLFAAFASSRDNDLDRRIGSGLAKDGQRCEGSDEEHPGGNDRYERFLRGSEAAAGVCAFRFFAESNSHGKSPRLSLASATRAIPRVSAARRRLNLNFRF